MKEESTEKMIGKPGTRTLQHREEEGEEEVEPGPGERLIKVSREVEREVAELEAEAGGEARQRHHHSHLQLTMEKTSTIKSTKMSSTMMSMGLKLPSITARSMLRIRETVLGGARRLPSLRTPPTPAARLSTSKLDR